MKKLTHLDDEGTARMVDVSAKAVTDREAMAEAVIVLSEAAFAAAKSGNAPKGDVLGAARIAGIMAAKKTAELIPLCHPLALTKVSVAFEWLDGRNAIRAIASARVSGQTGVEMEALTAAAVAALTIYDMVKGVDKGGVIETVRLLAKSGGKSGDFMALPAKTPSREQDAPKPRAKQKAPKERAAPQPGPHARREAFREFMASHRLRPARWAREAGIPEAQLLDYLTGQLKALPPDAARKLARAAKVRAEDMFR